MRLCGENLYDKWSFAPILGYLGATQRTRCSQTPGRIAFRNFRFHYIMTFLGLTFGYTEKKASNLGESGPKRTPGELSFSTVSERTYC